MAYLQSLWRSQDTIPGAGFAPDGIRLICPRRTRLPGAMSVIVATLVRFAKTPIARGLGEARQTRPERVGDNGSGRPVSGRCGRRY
jgi:hypothetical protein